MSRRDLSFLLLSLLVHGAFLWLLLGVELRVPDDFEFALPEAIEFGIYEEMEAVEDELAEMSTEEEADADSSSSALAKEGREAREKKEERKEKKNEATRDETRTPTPARIPPGSQIALRIDMAAVRASRLEGAARDLIRKIPDWHLIAGGSGIDPIDGSTGSSSRPRILAAVISSSWLGRVSRAGRRSERQPSRSPPLKERRPSFPSKAASRSPPGIQSIRPNGFSRSSGLGISPSPRPMRSASFAP